MNFQFYNFSIFKRIIFCLIFLSGFLAWGNAMAATYYIDYDSGVDSNNGTSTITPWKRCPGMTGFAGSYTHSAGDRFVFKGGVTWPVATLPLTIGYSGVAGNPDQYTTDETWYTGASFTQPKLIGDGTRHILYGVQKDYILINNLYIDAGASNASENIYGILWSGNASNGGGLEVSNCYITRGKTAFTIGSYGTVSNIKIHHNTIYDVCNALVSVPAGTNTISDFDFYNNIISGTDTMDCSTDHEDGIQISGQFEWTWTNVKIRSNQFRGKWMNLGTAILNLQWINGLEIYNNLITFENTIDNSETYLTLAAISLGYADSEHNNNIKIYNNTISSYANYASNKGWARCVMIAGNQGTVDIQNNILSNCEFGITVGTATGTTLTSDYNLYQRRLGGHVITTLEDHMDTIGASSLPCTKYGWECNSKSGNPLFVDVESDGTYGSMDFNLQPDSPAINAGADLSEYFTTDILGVTRSGVWDIGAYEYVGADDTTAPASPTGLSVS